MNDNIKIILIKYFTKSITYNELITLTQWVKEASEELFFKEFIQINYLADAALMDFDTDKEKQKLLLQINRVKKNIRRKKRLSYLKYASVVVLFVSIGGFFYFKNLPDKNQETKVSQQPKATTISPAKPNNIILTLDNGEEMVLDSQKEVALKNGSGNNQKIVYNNSKEEAGKTKITYNYLAIPKEAKYMVQLSDCTKIWMNANTKLKYPTRFAKNQPREVELLYGEAFFDVAKSKNSYTNSFKVKTKNQVIEVLGTEFNIKAYNDESAVTTTLVEGKVTVESHNKKVSLKPSEQSITNANHTITVQKVENVFDEIAWKEGYFVFNQKTIKDIMKSLARWNNIEYTFKNPETENKRFTGVIYRETSIDHILKQLQRTKELKIERHGNTVIIE